MRAGAVFFGALAAVHASKSHDTPLTQRQLTKNRRRETPADSFFSQNEALVRPRAMSSTGVLHGTTISESACLEEQSATKLKGYHSLGADIANSNGQVVTSNSDNTNYASQSESGILRQLKSRDTESIDESPNVNTMRLERLDRDEDVELQPSFTNRPSTTSHSFYSKLMTCMHILRQVTLQASENYHQIMELYDSALLEINPLLTRDVALRALLAFLMYCTDRGEMGFVMALFFSWLSNAIAIFMMITTPHIPYYMHIKWTIATSILFSASILYSVVYGAYQFVISDDVIRLSLIVLLAAVFDTAAMFALQPLVKFLLKVGLIESLTIHHFLILAITIMAVQCHLIKLCNYLTENMIDTFKTFSTKLKVSQRLAIIGLCERLNAISADDSSVCSVCHMPIHDSGEEVVTLPCKHVFHYSCICKWARMLNGNSCPMCRQIYC